MEVRFGAAPWAGGISLGDLFALLDRPAWHARALCRDHPEVDFFASRTKAAERLCRCCPVVEECGAWAEARSDLHDGVWAGRDYSRRAAWRRQVGPPDPDTPPESFDGS